MEGESQTQTQPQAKQLIADIFGDSDEDNNNEQPVKGSALASMNFDDSDDDIFGKGSDDEDRGASTTRKPAKSSVAQENLMDSDEEEVQPRKGVLRRKRTKGPPTKAISKSKRQKVAPSSKKSKRSSAEDDESGDEYDSGEEQKATREDQDFIAGEDDFADIVKEYDEDNTDFRDDRPDDDDYGGSKKKKAAAARSGNHLSSGINLKDTDPLSQTLAAMKQPKAKGLSDAEKDILVEKLQKQMAKAVEMDNELFAKGQPAVHKMALLSTVQTALMMKPLHTTLLDKDILCSLRDWIEPRDANTLPALSVRATIYELLMQLPCLPDHLKRTNGDKPPIGVVIVQLRKHKMETPANKRILKELMDKWSRPIFSKSADVRIAGSSAGAGALPTADHPEVQEAILQRYAQQLQAQGPSVAHSSSSGTSHGDNRAHSADAAAKPSRHIGFGSVMSGQAATSATSSDDGAEPAKKKVNDLYTRARTPYNTGFLFTVQPELKVIDKRNVMERTLGEGRMKLFKKTVESNGAGKGLGKKSNPRAMEMSVSTGPKH